MNLNLLRYSLILVFIMHAWLNYSQSLEFQNLTMADGLSNPIVQCIGQDKYGFIWVGTQKGLNVYDGTGFTHYFRNNEDEATLSGNMISDLVFDGDTAWVGTRSGLCKMDIKTKTVVRYDLDGNNEVRTLFIENNNNVLWVGTVSGLVKLNVQTNQFQVFNTSNSNLSHNTIRSIYKDSDSNLWIGTFDQLNVLQRNTQVITPISLQAIQKTNISYNLILSICPYAEDNDSLLWVGTETGLVLLNRLTGEKRIFHEDNSGLFNSVIKAIHRKQVGGVWLGTDFGLGEMKEDNSIITHFHSLDNNKSIVNSVVWDIFEDTAGTLWLGTNNGISTLSPSNQAFQFYPVTYNLGNKVLGYEIHDIIETSEEDFWIASQNGALKYGKNQQVLEILNSSQKGNKKLADDNTTRLFKEKNGNIWISSNGGLSVWNDNTKRLSSYSAGSTGAKGLRSNFVESFHVMKDGTMLVNTQKGLHRVIETPQGYEFEFIRTTHLSVALSGNNMWSFTENGLYKTNTNSFKRKVEAKFTDNGKKLQLLSILCLDNNNIWLGESNGLIHYQVQSKSYNYYQIKSDKSYPLISLESDSGGNIWAASYSAIVKFSVESKDYEIYPSGNNLAVHSFERGGSLKCLNGDLVFAGQDGFVRFSPERITKSSFVPQIHFTRLTVSNQEVLPNRSINNNNILNVDIAFASHIELDYRNRSFLVEFSSFHFGEGREGIRYAHKLDGVDTEWSYTDGSIGRASYSDIKPGNYTLLVKGTNKDGVWSENETKLNIKIKPPGWANPLFVIVYVLVFVAVVIFIIRYYRNRTKMRNQLKVARLEKEHADTMIKARQQFFTNISHEFRTPLSLIIGPAEKLDQQKELNERSKNYVRIIENNARRLLWLNNQLLDFRKLETKNMKLSVRSFNLVEFAKNIYNLFSDKAERKNISYEFYSDCENQEVVLDIRKVETILFNLLSNAFKFTSEAGTIEVRIEFLDQVELNGNAGARITVSDSGIGIAKEEQSKIFERFYQAGESVKLERGSGIGLTLVKEYVAMHQGLIELKSELGKGTTFVITLPLVVGDKKQDSKVSEKTESIPLLKPQSQSQVREKIIVSDSSAPSILLVEDEIEIAEFIMLGFKGKYKVALAKNGKDALRQIASKVPDLVISDINMPEMDGIEFTKRFKSNPKTAHVPLIILTGQSDSERQLEGLKCGADAYMVKPFEIELLEVRIDNFLKRQEQLTKLIAVNNIAKPQNVQLSNQDEKMLEKVVATIEKFISDPDLNIEKVCSHTGFSHSMLYRKIKNLTGQTLNEFIRTIRVQRAEQLLRTKKFNVAEVMHETGFTNHSYFSKSFRKLYKVSPKEYVQNM